ncbi:MAG: hypothetical protein ACLPQS_17385 [Acidimicrobiales bacterium]
MTTDEDRITALEDLLLMRIPPAEAQQHLRRFMWDSEPLVTLTRADLERVLDEYLTGRIRAEVVEAWAEALEGRDDVSLERGLEVVINDVVFELANPELTARLTATGAQELKRRLEER